MTDNKGQKEFRLPKRSFNIEFWVGLFALFAVGCFAYLAINIAGMKLSNAGYYPVAAVFTDVSGLKIGSPVEIAGVQVGQVTKVELEQTAAKVTMEIADSVDLRNDDVAQIRTKGIIGDRYIKISPGSSDQLVGRNGQIADTESAVDFEDILGKFIHNLEK